MYPVQVRLFKECMTFHRVWELMVSSARRGSTRRVEEEEISTMGLLRQPSVSNQGGSHPSYQPLLLVPRSSQYYCNWGEWRALLKEKGRGTE